MKMLELLETAPLEQSLLMGYYGGGNYGDELLLEVLAGLLKKRGLRNIQIAYQTPENYETFHHDFHYSLVAIGDKKQLLKSINRNKSIIIGGGGLWGVDVNFNVFLLSLLLFMSRLVLRKKIYLLGVGYYGSTSKLGHVSAWLAAKSASHIIARDPETLQNFKKFSQSVSLDTDIAYAIPELDLAPYTDDLKNLERVLPVMGKTLFIGLRRLDGKYPQRIEETLAANQDKAILVAIMEPKKVDTKNYKLIKKWEHQYQNVHAIDFSFNPLALYLFFKKYREQLALIAPHFHMIITAHLNGIPFLPIAYDNKVTELLKTIAPANILPIHSLTTQHVQTFVDNFYASKI